MPVLIYFVVCTILFVLTLATIKNEDRYVDVAGFLLAMLSYIPVLNVCIAYAVIATFFSKLFGDEFKFLKKKLF